jgi:putative membrane protein
MRHYLLAAALVAFAMPASAQTSPSTGASPGAPAASQDVAPDTFVQKAAVSDMFEIESSKLAEQKAKNPALKKFAKQMIRDHSKTSSKLKSLVQSGKVKNVQVPQQLDSDHQQKLDELRSVSGDQFDELYRSMQLEGHQQAVQLFDSEAKSGPDPTLKKFAASTLPHIKEHLSKIQSMRTASR